MEDMDKQVDLSKPVDFSYPEGFKEAADCLDFLPEDAREAMVAAVSSGMLQ